MMKTAIQHYQDKLSFEMDPSDLFAAFENKENVLLLKYFKNELSTR